MKWPPSIWLPAIGVGLSIVLCFVLFHAVLVAGSHPPYNHVLTTVERVDEDEDALRVYHDKARGVTCYETFGELTTALSCVPDVWLKTNP